MGQPGGIAGPDRALQAADLQSGHRRFQKPGMTKAPVVMIHGAFCGPWSLDGLKRKFKEAGYAVTTPCLRFHDQKPPPAVLGSTGLGDYAADLEDEIQGLGVAPILVGHSMGGLLAQQLAARTE